MCTGVLKKTGSPQAIYIVENKAGHLKAYATADMHA